MAKTTTLKTPSSSSLQWSPYLTLFLVIAALALYPFVFGQYMNLGISILLFAGFALAWDILGGWTGQNSLGNAVFVGIGAYSVAILASLGIAPWWGMLVGIALSALMAWGWGTMTFRLRGSYFTLSTIAIAEIVRLIALNEDWLTHGAEGINLRELPTLFGFDLFERRVEFYLVLLFVAGLLIFTHWLKRSKLGYYFRAVREDEDGAMALGINPTRAKIVAFILVGAFTAMGGSLWLIFLGRVDPDTVLTVPVSIQIALLAIIGGRGTIYGPLVGAFLIGVPSEVFRSQLREANLLVYGILIVIVIVYLPKGIVGTLENYFYRRNHPLEKGR
ncbi:MAG: branched-chain amino acid ABC transporter permease [Trueperaceae bacterium]